MDVDLLTAKAKWAVLEKLSRNESSPLEIAKQLNTSVANISTQLRYLELANVVKKRRIVNAAAGMPRILYSIQKPLCIVMAASENFNLRKIIDLDPEKEIILRIWQLPKATHGALLRFYLNYNSFFQEGYDVYFADYGDSVIKLIISNDKKPLPPKIVEVGEGDDKTAVDLRFVNTDEAAKTKRITCIYNGVQNGV